MNAAEIMPLIRNGSLERGAYTVNIAPGAFSEILGNQVLVYTHNKPDSDILAFSTKEFLFLIESAKKLPQEQFRALVTERYISKQDIGQSSDCPAVRDSKESFAREEVSLIESEALAIGWERDQLDELTGILKIYMPNCGIGEISLKAIQIIHFYPDGKIRNYGNFYNMRVPQPWIKKVDVPPTG